MDLNRIPKPLLVALVLLAGVAIIPLLSSPHSVCQSQLENFQESQAGFIYSKTEKKTKIPPRYDRAFSNCYSSNIGNTPGACAEYFDLLRGMLRDLQNISNECGEQVKGNERLMKAMTQSLKVFTEIAWGDPPPEENAEFTLATSWLEPADLSIFCSIKNEWVRFFGKESLAERKKIILDGLSGELKKFETTPEGGRVCLNCESLAKAKDKFEEKKIKTRSLFNLNCERYR